MVTVTAWQGWLLALDRAVRRSWRRLVVLPPLTPPPALARVRRPTPRESRCAS